MIAAYIDEIIMFCAGLWMTSVGFGYLPFPGNPAIRQSGQPAAGGSSLQVDGSLAARDRHRSGRRLLEQFQQKCVAVLPGKA
ncbi:hypothetical protein J2W92_000406 [Rhizobium leguminosarum]